METLAAHPDTKIVAVVHAETSTGAEFPLQELATAMRASGSDALLYVDCVTSLGGQQVEAEAWGIDYGYSCSQKALGCPPGIAPVTSATARSSGSKTAQDARSPTTTTSKSWRSTGSTGRSPITTRCRSCSTTRCTPASAWRSTRAWRTVGLATRTPVATSSSRSRARGFELLADPDHQLVELTAIKVPEGIDGKEVQARFLREFNLEVGGGLGPKAPPIWRVGLMGVNANRETADRVLGAFDAVLPR